MSTANVLLNKTILVVCSAKKVEDLVCGLKAMGANVLPFPILEAQEVEDKGPLDKALASLQEYAWIIFTSSYGVSFFMQRMDELRIARNVRAFPKICAVGTATAGTLQEYGVEATLIPKKFVAEGVLEALEKYHGGLRRLSGQRILLPRAKEARDVLPRSLAAAGAQADVVPCYQTVRAELDEGIIRKVRAQIPDLLVFTSSSAVKNLIGILGEEDGTKILMNATVAALGPITAGTVESYHKSVDIMPKESTMASLIGAIRKHYADRSS